MTATPEVCINTVLGLSAWAVGGADRIELCSGVALGGLTPAAGLMSAATNSHIPVYAMIRPRFGDFCYDEAEVIAMLAEIDVMRAASLAGSGITSENASEILAETGVSAIHSSCANREISNGNIAEMGFVGETSARTDADKIALLKRLLATC